MGRLLVVDDEAAFPGLVRALLGDAHTEWILAVNRCRRASEGYASAEMEIWDGTGEHLVAYATQQMVFVFPDGPPPPEERVPVTEL